MTAGPARSPEHTRCAHRSSLAALAVCRAQTHADRRTFLALDLGGTNLRVCEVKLEGNHKFSQKQQKYRVSEDLKEGEARTLFSESPRERPGAPGTRAAQPLEPAVDCRPLGLAVGSQLLDHQLWAG